MALPLFFPCVNYKPQVDRTGAITIERLCELSKVRCAAFGSWVNRQVVLVPNHSKDGLVEAEPGDWNVVLIGIPTRYKTETSQARWALGVMAYVMFDGVARASIAGQPWAVIEQSRGRRPGIRRPKTNAERQSAWRLKHQLSHQ